MSRPVYKFFNKLYVSNDNGNTWETKNIKLSTDTETSLEIEKITDCKIEDEGIFLICNDRFVICSSIYDNRYELIYTLEDETDKLVKFMPYGNIYCCTAKGNIELIKMLEL